MNRHHQDQYRPESSALSFPSALERMLLPSAIAGALAWPTRLSILMRSHCTIVGQHSGTLCLQQLVPVQPNWLANSTCHISNLALETPLVSFLTIVQFEAIDMDTQVD